MSRLEHRVKTLEEKQNGNGPAVFVFPSTADPKHEFHSDEAYYQDLAENTYGRNDFGLAVWNVDERRAEPMLMFIDDIDKMLQDVSENSTRIGVDPVMQSAGGE